MLRLHLGLSVFLLLTSAAFAQEIIALPGTKPLEMEGDIAAQMVEGVDAFLQRKIEESAKARERYWRRDFSSVEAYLKSVEPNRRRLAKMLGAVDARISPVHPEVIQQIGQPAVIAAGTGYEVFAVRWPVLGFPQPGQNHSVSLHGEGLLLVPSDGKQQIADIIALPDADQTPEQIAGLAEGIDKDSQYARRLAEQGCRVLIPTLISRQMEKRNGRANLTNREYLYRSGFELGRHLLGYEVQKVLAGVDWFAAEAEAEKREAKIGVIGYGEGGGIALYAAALDQRIEATCVSGYFDDRTNLWQQPIDRNVFGLLSEFGDAELARLIVPRSLVIDMCAGPKVTLPSEGGAPAELAGPSVMVNPSVVQPGRKFEDFSALEKELQSRIRNVVGAKELFDFPKAPFGTYIATRSLLEELNVEPRKPTGDPLKITGELPDAAVRQKRQLEEIDRHNQWLLAESEYVREEFMKDLDTSSLEKYQQSVEKYRKIFKEEVIGAFEDPLLPFNAKSRQAYKTEKFTGYEVVLDVFPDVFAYGILLVPNDLPRDGSEKRPVVVCQHGLEGRPQDVVAGDHRAYHDYAAKLAERGFITFSPQNLYIGGDKFRVLQRKANPLGKTLFSVIVPQHQQIVNWLKKLPYADGGRIAFYGLSYGGKSAMRIPALVPDYCLSICSADFNEWVWKNASTRSNYSYVWTGEYEIFEWNLGSTFNYAEMAALICPRPFMVERGHFDGVAPDSRVGQEFAKVRHLYNARLGIGQRCEIEWFAGPHTIHGVGTFAFLHKHLNWPER